MKMESKKEKKSKKAKYSTRKEVPQKNDLKTRLQNIKDKLGQLEKKEFWNSHLPWPKFLRKPKIRFIAPRISGSFPIPNRTGMFIIAIFLVGFSLACGAYDLISKTYGRIAIGYDSSTSPATPIFFLEGMHDQFFLEGIIAFAIIMCGLIGFLFIHQSTKHFYKPKYSYMLFAVGIGLLFFAFISMLLIVHYGKNIPMYSNSW